MFESCSNLVRILEAAALFGELSEHDRTELLRLLPR